MRQITLPIRLSNDNTVASRDVGLSNDSQDLRSFLCPRPTSTSFSSLVLPFPASSRCKNVIKGERSRGSRTLTREHTYESAYVRIMKVDGNRPLCASEWRPKATKVPQHVCSCSGYVHTHATSVHSTYVHKCQLDVQLYAKNASRPAGRRLIDSPWRPRGKRRNRLAAGRRVRVTRGLARNPSRNRNFLSPFPSLRSLREWVKTYRVVFSLVKASKYHRDCRENSFSHFRFAGQGERTFVFLFSTKSVKFNLSRWNDVPRTSKIAMFSQF